MIHGRRPFMLFNSRLYIEVFTEAWKHLVRAECCRVSIKHDIHGCRYDMSLPAWQSFASMHIQRSCRGLTIVVQTSSLPSVIKLQIKLVAVVMDVLLKGTICAGLGYLFISDQMLQTLHCG